MKDLRSKKDNKRKPKRTLLAEAGKLLPVVRQQIIDGFTPKATDVFRREFDFFDKVTSISGVLFPKEE
ncbi:Phosphatidylinositol 4-kinase alpha 1 [Camellia lanceoleosa]|uniref:Phosphatidylinositol 4-kinase alpha 1 n=1 Tax=Camellia lanceoleosa TaxID=1840588 RepID=A0ACC0GLH4_9ERIC|nr:Phosphatidylinositol 4-kinase alpha 1 [Camellia lanceoleosa]